jgi:hypothetical protein
MLRQILSIGLSLAILVVVSAAQAATPTLTIPKLANAPSIDGRMAPGEWDDAAGMSGIVSQLDGFAHPRQAVFFVAYDDENLYLAQRSTVFPEELKQYGPTTWGKRDSSFFVGLAAGRKGKGDGPALYVLRALTAPAAGKSGGEMKRRCAPSRA